MATRTDSENLKRLARAKLAEGRAGISAESRRLKQQLNPRIAMHRVVDQHTGGLMIGTFAAGLVLSFLIFRDHAAKEDSAPSASQKKSDDRPKKNSNGSIPAMLARAAAPALVKFAIANPLEQWLARGEKKPDATA